MEAAGGTPEPAILKLGGERGWWEVRRDGEDEEGWGVQVCRRGSEEERSSVWRETRKEVAGVRQRGQRWSTPCTAGCNALSNCSERDFWQSWDSILSFWWQNLLYKNFKWQWIWKQPARKCFYLTWQHIFKTIVSHKVLHHFAIYFYSEQTQTSIS